MERSPRRQMMQLLLRAALGRKGSVLIYVVAVMTVFGLLGAAMVAMFSSATMMSTGSKDYAREARYMAEAGMRYATSDLRNAGYNSGVIADLNDTAFTVTDSGTFDLNVFGRWFEAAADYPGTANINLSIPDGEAPGEDVFSIPAGAYLANLESFRDSFVFGDGSTKGSFYTEIGEKPTLAKGATSFEIVPADDFTAVAAENHRMLLAVKPSENQSVSADGNLKVTYSYDSWNTGAKSFFPSDYGSFYVVTDEGVINRYFYEKTSKESATVALLENLKGNEFPLAVTTGDLIFLSNRNHVISASGSAGGTGSGGNRTLSMDFRQNIESPQSMPAPSPLSLPADISPADFASPQTATPASKSGAVSVTTTSGQEKVSLGGNTGNASGAAWYGGNVSRGGFDVCTSGECEFNNGVRAFFVFDYNGTGDGFTFTVASGSENGLDAYGGTGEDMGYAGVSPTWKRINKPKMAVEFDTYTNSASYPTGRNDPGSSNKDYIQYVYWGSTPTDPDDDNVHDTGGSGQKWSPYPTVAAVRTKTLLDTDGTYLYANADGYLYGIDPDTGGSLFGWPYYFNPYLTASSSSPILDSSGFIVMGEDYGGTGYIDSIKADGSGYNGSPGWETTTGVVDSSPVIDSSGVVYFGTNSGYFYAIVDSNIPGNNGDFKWAYVTGGGYDIDGTPALSPDESTVYFVTRDPGYLYALNTSSGAYKWRFYLNDKSESSPRVAGDGTIYVGSDSDYLYAVTDNGTSASMKWGVQTGGNVRSRPAVGSDGTIYVGSDDDDLYAIEDGGTSASVKWQFPTGGHVKGSPMVHDDGTIWFGSDDNYLYVVDSGGHQVDRYNLGGHIQAPATQGPDGSVYVGSDSNHVYAFTPSCQPRNIRDLSYTSDDLPGDITVSDNNNWLNSGPWAVRMEITRSTARNSRNKYEYTLKMWLRQCKNQDCTQDTSDRTVVGSYFQDTRIEYAAKTPDLEQTVELCESDHLDLDTFIFGYTEGTGGAVQTVDITDTQLGFIRPGDFVITDDPDWP